MNKLLPLYLLLLVILASSCKKELVGIKSKKKSAVNIEEIDFDYFQTKTKIRYTEGDKQVSGNANIRIKKDSLIWISVSPSIGIEATRVMISKDTALIINRIDKEFYVFNFEEISRYFNFKVDFDLIQSILLGNLVRPIDDKTQVARENNYFLVKQKSGPLDIQSFVQTANKKIETVLINEIATDNFMTLKYSDFKQTGAYLFAKVCLVNLTYKTNKGPLVTSINLQHNKAEIVDKPLKFPFNIPTKYDAFK
ncbi:MAG: DUF4292 domain-containing protein [Cyclobacteriaceae bacterium]|nr:DUF4292 domain-containing protein [Cyclobacteriaceae bacterium]